MKKILFSLCFLKLSVSMAPIYYQKWIIHNVGQGQWATFSNPTICLHFDFGGENFRRKYLQRLFIKNCSQKENQLYLSHADLDHYSFYKMIWQNSKNLCWQFKPLNFSKLKNIPSCKKVSSAKLIYSDYYEKNKNASSGVIIKDSFLFSGDSPVSAERKWAGILKEYRIKYFMLGHHGSSTSTSDQLLKNLSQALMAISSARFKRYGHPHQKVLLKLKRNHIPLLKTEDWGNLIIQI